MRFLRDNGLSILFGCLFVGALVGQMFAGLAQENEELLQHNMPPVSLGEFVTSSQFVVDVAENWQSEFLQFFLFILATVWFVQRGSPESKRVGDQGIGTDAEQKVGEHSDADSPAWAQARGLRLTLFSNSLLIVMGAIFLLSWLAQALAGTVVANAENAEHGESAVTWAEYVVSPDFWNRTLQNWQSEFLAVGSMIALSIFLRQRGSSESKPVGAPHRETAVESE